MENPFKSVENRKTRIALTIGTLVVAAIVLFVVTRKMKSLFAAWKDAQDYKSEQTVLGLQGHKLTYPKQWYEAQARKVYLGADWSWYDWNCDEQTTMNALTELRNDLDYLELIAQFGIRDGYDMHGFIDSCLNQGEKDRVNRVWAGYGMKKRL